MDDIRIRRARESDRVPLARLLAYGFAQDFSALCKDLDRVARALESGLRLERFFVAACDSTLLGAAACTDRTGRAVAVLPADLKKQLGWPRGWLAAQIFRKEFAAPLTYPPDTGFIEFVTVAADARRHGIATRLLEGVCAQTPYTAYELDVIDRTPGAKACYERFGFVAYRKIEERHSRTKGFASRWLMRYQKP